jgi:ribonuclease E
MANKMLIDASHPEETRVVVVRGQKVEEFDFESANRKQLRGNIYLAKVTRVEPSLQAAFVEYGGNRHGFLAFSEIHPDYYQIPVADRQALLEAEAEAHREEEHEEERRSSSRGGGRRRRSSPRRAQNDETVVSTEAEAGTEEGGEAAPEGREPIGEAASPETSEAFSTVENGAEASAENAQEDALEAAEGSAHIEASNGDATAEEAKSPSTEDDTESDDEDDSEDDEDDVEEHEIVEQLGGDDAIEDMPQRRRTPRKQYKIQEVIKRRQILLVQVVKEERGNKGAALTTYLSLAGRYSVLMPNTGRGGGISRKITNAADRKRLKEIAQELEVPEGMGIILRTAGASRTKPEIKRDYEYLMRLWESVRELTLKSAAPALVYEEGSLIKRAIRDLYNKDIDDVMVAGEEGYREAKDFMRMLMPSHSKLVQPYREPQPLFAKHGVEAQLDAMFSNVVTLKSGGYLVINPTEALVSIDVNSGRSTREHNIEDTALRTNLEASEEIARQLRLRDLAGLVVIDFIDMEEKRNNRAVEKKLNECLKNDRARIQVGRISPFGLLEMSRQRIRTGVLESSSIPCPHCAGTGFVRSTPSVALQVLRSIEETLIKNAGYNLVVRTRTEAAFYILNQKRIHLRELEARFGVAISIVADDTLQGHTTYASTAATRPSNWSTSRPRPASRSTPSSPSTNPSRRMRSRPRRRPRRTPRPPAKSPASRVKAKATAAAAAVAAAVGAVTARPPLEQTRATRAPRVMKLRVSPTRKRPRPRLPEPRRHRLRPASPTRSAQDVAAVAVAAVGVDAVVTRPATPPRRTASTPPIRPRPHRLPMRPLPQTGSPQPRIASLPPRKSASWLRSLRWPRSLSPPRRSFPSPSRSPSC